MQNRKNSKKFVMNRKNFTRRLALPCAALLSVLAPLASRAADAPAPLPSVKIVASDPTALEGVSSGAFTVLRGDTATADLSVNLKISGTASNGVDYVLIPATVTIPAGFQAASLPIVPINNSALADNKTVVLTLDTNANYHLESPRHATVTILDNRFNNKPPIVAIVSPADGAVFTPPTNIVIQAEASDVDDAVKSVSFYADDHFLGSLTQAPYSLTWSNAPVGAHALFARATDAFGRSALSAPVHITVSNAPPAVKLTSPADGAVFKSGDLITLAADASDADDSVKSVSFYDGRRLIGSVQKLPYTLVWSNAPAGGHSITAKAVDTFGQVVVSSPAVITVSNTPPVVTLVSPLDGATMRPPTNVTVTAEASDPDGQITRVVFYDNDLLVGSVAKAPYTIILKNPAAGDHSLTAKAFDNNGSSTVSKAVKFTVVNAAPKVAITAPANNAAFTRGSTITITSEASDADNAVQRVSFYANNHLLGVVYKAPYTLDWKHVEAGTYTLTSRATDQFGLQTVSGPVKITVTK